MAKGTTTDFSEENTESAMQVMDWMRDLTEQSLNQSKSALEGFFTTARKASEDIDEQASNSASGRCYWPKRRSPTPSTLRIKLFMRGNLRICSSFRASLSAGRRRSLRNKAKSWGRPRCEELKRSEGRLIRGWRKHLEEGPKPLKGKSW